MTTHDTAAVLLTGGAVAACGVVLMAVRRRGVPGGPGLALAAGSLAVWMTGIAVQTLSTDHAIKRATVTVVFTAICTMTLGFWCSASEAAGRARMSSREWLVLAAPAPVTVLLCATGWGGLMFQSLVIPAGQGPVDNVPGPWYVVHVLWAYALILASLVVFTRAAWRAPRRYRPQAVLMIALVLTPLTVNAASVAELIDPVGYDPTPFTLLVSVFGFMWGIKRMNLIDAQIGLLPVARDLVVEAMRDGVVVVDGRERVLDLNPAAAALLGAAGERLVGRDAAALIAGWSRGAITRGSWEFETRTEGGPRTFEVTVNAMQRDDPRTPSVVMLRDVTERRLAESSLAESARLHHHQSRHDALTGLANRTLLFERLREALRMRGACGPSLLILDLDGFKDLNDTFGHRAGDEALRELGGRLSQAAGDDAMVARLAGDEFAVLFPAAGRDDALEAAFHLLDAVQVAVDIEGTHIALSGSIGVAVAPDHGEQADDLVHAADVAMYHAKRNNTGVAVYASAADVRRPDRLLLREELRRAISAGELEVHYQPQCTSDGRLVGAEALVRWRHPDRGLLLPRDFLGLAEESDLICELTDAVLATSLRDAARWDATGTGLRVAVNISTRDLRDPRLEDRVHRALAACGVAATALTLEVTENSLASARDAVPHLEALRADGVRVSLDDFGTGFAPLATLREMPVDELKIDRTFVRGMAEGARDAALVGGLIRLGHDLGLTVVAEGVETRDGADRLAELSCDVLQGHLVGRPRPAADAAALR
ncbi:MAG: EAL domain-containing protein [Thermoleophilia bacterium]|nr:EAL domain-containing protein [Thermoleophilia bacterium]